MKGVARVFLDWTDGPAPIEFGPDTNVYVNGWPVAVEGSNIACHQHGDTTVCQAKLQIGSSDVRAGGRGILRYNDQATCQHSIMTASTDVKVP